MSTIWGYFGFIRFVCWSRTLIASDSEPLESCDSFADLPRTPYRTVFNPSMLRFVSNESKKHVVNMRNRFPWSDMAKQRQFGKCLYRFIHLRMRQNQQLLRLTASIGWVDQQFPEKSWAVPCTEIGLRYFPQWCDFLLRGFFWRPLCFAATRPTYLPARVTIFGREVWVWKERRMFEFSPRLRETSCYGRTKSSPPDSQSLDALWGPASF